MPNIAPRYDVLTWDPEREEYTPQDGLPVPSENVTLWQVRTVLRALRTHGYGCWRIRDASGYYESDTSVLVERRKK
jgi:hypothetical protein